MDDVQIQDILDIRYQTQILESLGWDEQLFTQLFEYLNNEFRNFNLKHPAVILNVIELNFGKATSDIFVDLFNNKLELILYQNNGNINEH